MPGNTSISSMKRAAKQSSRKQENSPFRKQVDTPTTKKQDHITMPELVKKLIVPPEQRTNADCKLMAEALFIFITSLASFKEGFLRSDALAVARTAELKTVDDRQTVFLQGDVGGDFYFVLQGSVAIEINRKIIKILGDKTAFGELAMQCKCKRSASVLGAEDNTRLLVIRKKLYHRHLAATHRAEMASKMKFLKKLKADKLTPLEIAILCTCIKMKKVRRNQKICSFDSPAESLYYIIEGCADEISCDNGKNLQKIIDGHKKEEPIPRTTVAKTPAARMGSKKKRMTRVPARKKNNNDRLTARRKSTNDRLEVKKKPEMHRIAKLLQGQMFGEASWVYGQQAMTTVIARSECKVWYLPFTNLSKIAKQTVHVRHNLEQLARMKLRFRIQRLETLRRARESLQQPDTTRPTKPTTQKASKRRRGRIKAWADTIVPQTPSASTLVAIQISRASDSSNKQPTTPRPGTYAMPHVRQSKLSLSLRGLAKAQVSGQHADKALPRVGRKQNRRKESRYRSCDGIKYRLTDKYDRANVIPREILASVVDDFNSGDPELEFPQQQLVSVLGKYLSSTACQSSMSNVFTPRSTNENAKKSSFKVIY